MKLLIFFLALDAVAQPVKIRTNDFTLSWNRPPGYIIFSNRITRTASSAVTQWWVADITQSVFSVVSTQRSYVPWTITVAALGLQLSPESEILYWPPLPVSNHVFSFYMIQPVRLTILNSTNPIDNLFMRLKFFAPDAQFTNPMWFPQISHDLKSWSNFGSPIMAPANPKLEINITNYGY